MSEQANEGQQPAPTTPAPDQENSGTTPPPEQGGEGGATAPDQDTEAATSPDTPGYIDPATKAESYRQDAERLADESA